LQRVYSKNETTDNASPLPQPVPTLIPNKVTVELAHTWMQICISATSA